MYTTPLNAAVVNPDLDPVNRAQQVSDYPRFAKDGVPLAVTVTLPPMLKAKYIIMSVPGIKKANAIRNVHSYNGLLKNAPFNPAVPASFFNQLSSEVIQVYTDTNGASLLPS